MFLSISKVSSLVFVSFLSLKRPFLFRLLNLEKLVLSLSLLS